MNDLTKLTTDKLIALKEEYRDKVDGAKTIVDPDLDWHGYSEYIDAYSESITEIDEELLRRSRFYDIELGYKNRAELYNEALLKFLEGAE